MRKLHAGCAAATDTWCEASAIIVQVMRSDEPRDALGYMSVDATRALADQGVWVLDPNSTLIGRSVLVGSGTLIYPGVVISCDPVSAINLGERCVLYPGSLLEAGEGGRIVIGDEVELGPGGVTIRAIGSDATVLEDLVRLSGNCELTGACVLGRGAQMLGSVSARSVRLAGGLGGYRWPDPDERGAVLKGAGIADGITLGRGEVRSCRASFNDATTERQSSYHPPATP